MACPVNSGGSFTTSPKLVEPDCDEGAAHRETTRARRNSQDTTTRGFDTTSSQSEQAGSTSCQPSKPRPQPPHQRNALAGAPTWCATGCSSTQNHMMLQQQRSSGCRPSGTANPVWRRAQRRKAKDRRVRAGGRHDGTVGRAAVEQQIPSDSVSQLLFPGQRFREDSGAVNETIRALEGLNHADHPCHCPQLA